MNRQLKDFLDYLAFVKRRSSHTITSYQNDINSLLNYISDQYDVNDISQVSHLMIRSWIVQLKSEDISNVSINRKISALKSFYQFLRRKELVKINPMAKVQTLKSSKRLPSFVPKKKMDYLLEEPLEKSQGFAKLRASLIIDLLYMTGIRRSELLNLKYSDVDESRLEIKVLGKGNKERRCPITKVVIQKIATYKSEAELEFGIIDHDFIIITDKGKKAYPKLIFNIVSRQLKAINASEKTSPHVLRHTFATHVSSNGAELNAIKELLGHASLAATQIYTHNSIERLKKEYKKAHPKAELD